ncbi:MAG: hypothetical protein ACOYOO_10550, partial [Saprospiraceae bacterium]
RNHEKQVSIQILFGAKRQEEPFYTTSQKKILPPKVAKDFWHNPLKYLSTRSSGEQPGAAIVQERIIPPFSA